MLGIPVPDSIVFKHEGLSALKSHEVYPPKFGGGLAGYTAGWEFHPPPKCIGGSATACGGCPEDLTHYKPKTDIVKIIKMGIINTIPMNKALVIISQLLIKKGKTIAVAESCTGGLLANLLTNIPGSSKYFLLGIVAYSNQAKTSLLKIPGALIRRYGAVSYQVCRLMAKNIREIASSDYGIGITGIAGPLGGTRAKPVGTVYICAAAQNKSITKKICFSGSRLVVKRKAVLKALSMLKELL